MILLKKILVATDFNQPSDAALTYGRALAQRFDATLTVLHVAHVVTTAIGTAGGRFVDAQRDAEEAARLRVQALLTEEERRALGAMAVAIVSVVPEDTIVRFAKDADVDLIVLGTHGRSGVAHMLLGSVAEKVVRTAPCPVLTVKHFERDFVLPDVPGDANGTPLHQLITLNRILVPTDFSETSETAVRYAVALARAFNAKLYMLHVEPRHDLEIMVEGELVVEKSLSDLGAVNVPQNAARELLGRILTEQERTDVQAEYVLRASGLGGPDVEIVRYAQERDTDLIVLGTHGRGVADVLLGSVAEKVVRLAPCPVLTVRHPQHEFVMPEAAAAEPVMSRLFEWRSLSTIQYSRSEGLAALNFVAERGCFEYQLPGALLRVFDATSFDDLHRLKDLIEATLASAHDVRRCVAFIDRHATPSR
jgi:nucleotide-binding universal stress UspA family protein